MNDEEEGEADPEPSQGISLPESATPIPHLATKKEESNLT